MGEVTQLKSDIVETIEDLLHKAKTGEIDAIAFVVSCGDKYTGNGWIRMPETNVMQMMGEMACLQRDFMDKEIELRVDPQTGETY